MCLDVCLSPRIEMESSLGSKWKLRHCLCGLKDGARQFHLILKEKLVRLGDRKFKLDTAVFELYTHELNDIVEHWLCLELIHQHGNL